MFRVQRQDCFLRNQHYLQSRKTQQRGFWMWWELHHLESRTNAGVSIVLKLLDFAILSRVATEVVAGGQQGTVPGKWSYAVKPINLLKAARVVTCQMKNRSKTQEIVFTLSQSISISFSCQVYPKVKDIEKVREVELLQLWVQWAEQEQ